MILVLFEFDTWLFQNHIIRARIKLYKIIISLRSLSIWASEMWFFYLFEHCRENNGFMLALKALFTYLSDWTQTLDIDNLFMND